MTSTARLVSETKKSLGRLRFRAERQGIIVKVYPNCPQSREVLARVRAEYVEFPYIVALVKHGYKVTVFGQTLCLASELISYDQFDGFELKV